MPDKWIVQNNVHGPLHLPRNKIRLMKFGDEIDLVSYTGKTIDQLELDPEIGRAFSFNHLKEVQKGEIIKENQVSALEKKIDKLFELLSNKSNEVDLNELASKIIFAQEKNFVKNEDNLSQNVVLRDEEERMREDALAKLISSAKKPEQKMDSFGKNEKEVESDGDFTDLIDLG